MNTEFALEVFKSIGLGIGIGSAFFIVPFGMLFLLQMLPWALSKIPFLGHIFVKVAKDKLNNHGDKKQIYIDDCHPSQVIKRFKEDGLQSLFRNYSSTQAPIQEPNSLCDKNVPEHLLNSADPIPINKELQNGIDNLSHTDKLSQDDKAVNQNGTIPQVEKLDKLTLT